MIKINIMSSHCVICFKEFIQENLRNPSQKLSELCSKYLHFAFPDEEFQSSQENLSFCPKCFESATELVHFEEKMEYYQRKISELVLSLEILHHSRKVMNTNFKMTDDIYSEKELTDFNNENQIVTPGDIFTDNFDDSIFPVFTDDENIVDVPFAEIEHGTKTQYFIDEILGVETTVEEESEVINTNLVHENQHPLLKLQRIQFYGSEKDMVVVKSDTVQSNDEINIVWSKIGLSGSYRITDTNENTQSSKSGLEEIKLLPNSVVETVPKYSATNSFIEDLISEQSQTCHETLEISPSTSHHDQDRNTSCEEKHLENNLRKKRFYRKLKHPTKIQKWKPIFHCDMCTKEFSDRHKLLQHKIVHRDDQPHGCEICKKRFKRKSCLTRHLKSHRRTLSHIKPEKVERIYECDLCLNSFVNKSNMLFHRRCHTGEKRYQCDECEYVCNVKSHLKRHKIYRHSTKNNFKCRECGHRYKFAIDAKKHYKMTHFGLDFSEDCLIKIS